MPALTLTPAWLWIGAHPVGEAVAHAVEVVRRNGRSLGHGGLRGGGHAVAVADDRPLVLRHDGDDEGALELQRDGGNELRKKIVFPLARRSDVFETRQARPTRVIFYFAVAASIRLSKRVQ